MKKAIINICRKMGIHCPVFLRGVFISLLYLSNHKNNYGLTSDIKIAFLIQRTELFNSIKTVVDTAAKKNCEIFFIPLPRHIMGKNEFDIEEYHKVYDFCNNLQIGDVIQAFDENKQKYINLYDMKFDYIFLNTPYSYQYPDGFSFDDLSQYGKLCYVAYGYSLLEKHLSDIYCNRPLAENISFIFAANDMEYSYAQRFLRYAAWLNRKKLYNVGFPRFDLIDKKKSSEKTILWIPRYTTNIGVQAKNEQSSFFVFYKHFFHFAQEHGDYNFIIRPHPLMFDNFIAKGVMSVEEIAAFKCAVQNNSNITLDETPNYLETFNKASILLADFSSTVAEYYVSGKPIVYFGPKKDFSKYDSDMYDTFYTVGTWDEAEDALMQLMEGVDPKKEQREACVREFLSGKDGNAGRAIMDVILKDYERNNKR